MWTWDFSHCSKDYRVGVSYLNWYFCNIWYVICQCGFRVKSVATSFQSKILFKDSVRFYARWLRVLDLKVQSNSVMWVTLLKYIHHHSGYRLSQVSNFHISIFISNFFLRCIRSKILSSYQPLDWNSSASQLCDINQIKTINQQNGGTHSQGYGT